MTRVQRIDDLVEQAARSLIAGEVVDVEAILREHPDLLPELSGGLQLARIAADRKQVRPCVRKMSVVHVLTDSELAEPISCSSEWERAAEAPAEDGPRPEIEGYHVEDQIGRGGQATVYLGRRADSDLPVAIKVLRRKPGGTTDALQSRFEREAEALRRLDCPNIVKVVDRGITADGRWFIATPYILGWNLDEYLWLPQCLGDSDASLVVELFAKIADALHGAHRAGIVHRDLKPQNIRVGRDGTPYLLDFGLAHFGGEAEGWLIGSTAWLSPEQANNGQVDARSDIYALGMMLYRAIARRPAYEVNARDLSAAKRTILSAKVDPLAASPLVRSGVTPEMDCLVQRCLEKSPSKRPTTASGFAAELLVSIKPTRRKGRSRMAGITVLCIGVLAALGITRHIEQPRVDQQPFTFMQRNGVRFWRLPPVQIAKGDGLRSAHAQIWFSERISRPLLNRLLGRSQHGVPARGDFSWSEAARFCSQISGADGCFYRLPTVAECRWASRVGRLKPEDNEVIWCSDTQLVGARPTHVIVKQGRHGALFDLPRVDTFRSPQTSIRLVLEIRP